MSVTTIEIVLELDAADRPTGTATAAGGEPQAFHGWLELVSAIGALSGTQSSPTSSIQGDPR